jgi:hypothetical protein
METDICRVASGAAEPLPPTLSAGETVNVRVIFGVLGSLRRGGISKAKGGKTCRAEAGAALRRGPGSRDR